MQNQMIKS